MRKIITTAGTLGLVGCALIASPSAMADDSGWYMGGNIGQSRARIDNARITSGLLGAGFAVTSITDDNRDTGYKLFGGYKFNKNFALEAGYFNLGQFGFTSTTTPVGALNGKIKLDGLNLDAVGILPITEKFSAFGRIGLNYAEAKDNFTSAPAVVITTNPNPSQRDTNLKVGLGLQYNFTKSFGMRVEAERYRIDDAVGNKGDIDLISVGLVYQFGEETPAPAPLAAAPEPVVAAAPPPPAPVVAAAPLIVIVPVKVRTEQYCSILDLTFEINADEMQRDDKEKLAVLGTYMKKYSGTTAVVEGHTDNVGEDDYNMKLSQRRADSVVNYLAENNSIDRSRLVAIGYGETRPIADNSTSEGKRANRRINTVIACVKDVADLKVAAARVTMAMEMEFDPYKADIDPKYRDGLREVADFMKANPTVTATVEGHAGKLVGVGSKKETASPELALEISQRRSQNVVNYLVDNLGVTRSRLSVAQFGQTRRVTYGTTLDEQQENRRVNIIFNYIK